MRYIQRRLRHTATSEDEEYVAHPHRGYGRHGGHRQHIYSGHHTYNKPVTFGHSRHQSTHHYQTQKQQESDYKNWKNGHHSHSGGHHYCAWGPGCPDEDESKVLDNFFDDYDKKDIKVIADFLRSDAYEDYVESEDYN